MFAFVVFDSFFSLLSREIGWEERLQNDLYGVTQSSSLLEIKVHGLPVC